MNKITQKKLKELFSYQYGNLIRKTSVRYNALSGAVAGSKTTHGYIETRVCGKRYYNHRLIWLYHKGYMPETEIDHINNDKTDNRIENLREATSQCNMRNYGNPTNNTSGIKGVYLNKKQKCWVTQIKLNQKMSCVGVSNDFVEAVAYRLAAEQCLDWSNCNSSSPAFKYMTKWLKEKR